MDIFNLDGTFNRRFASNGVLNAPWGVAKAGASFGEFSNDILIANFGDGTINAYNPTTGAVEGRIKNTAGEAILIPGLRGITFGAPGTPEASKLYFTAGVTGQPSLIGTITVAPVRLVVE